MKWIPSTLLVITLMTNFHLQAAHETKTDITDETSLDAKDVKDYKWFHNWIEILQAEATEEEEEAESLGHLNQLINNYEDALNGTVKQAFTPTMADMIKIDHTELLAKIRRTPVKSLDPFDYLEQIKRSVVYKVGRGEKYDNLTTADKMACLFLQNEYDRNPRNDTDSKRDIFGVSRDFMNELKELKANLEARKATLPPLSEG